MRLTSKILTFVAPAAALLALSGCATGFRSDVTTFSRLPAPEGQSFYVQTKDPALKGGLEFSHYAGIVSQKLTAQGYRPADNARSATLVVDVDYGVDRGREKIETRPGVGYGGGFGYGGWCPSWGRFGGWYGQRRWGYGWYDPFWADAWNGWGYPETYSYTVYASFLDMTVTRATDGVRLYEGHAQAQSQTNDLTRIVPNLVEAMFARFPGQSGQTARVLIDSKGRSKVL